MGERRKGTPSSLHTRSPTSPFPPFDGEAILLPLFKNYTFTEDPLQKAELSESSRELKQDTSPVADCGLTNGGGVRLWHGVLAGQSHLGGRRIGPIALKEASKCHGKA